MKSITISVGKLNTCGKLNKKTIRHTERTSRAVGATKNGLFGAGMTIDLGAGSGDTLYLFTGANTIGAAATVGIETIIGNAGVDTVTMAAGGGTFYGQGGNDVLTAAGGVDIFQYDAIATGDGNDTIASFTAGADIIDIIGKGSTAGTGVAITNDGTTWTVTINNETVATYIAGADITFFDGEKVTLTGLTCSTALSATNFM